MWPVKQPVLQASPAPYKHDPCVVRATRNRGDLPMAPSRERTNGVRGQALLSMLDATGSAEGAGAHRRAAHAHG